MSATQVNGSTSLTLFDSRVVADLCAGNFVLDVTPSIFLQPNDPLGVKVKITGPYGLIKDYTNSYDITQPFVGTYTTTVPTRAGIYSYGTYTFDFEITDIDNKKYYCSNSVKLCEWPDNVSGDNNCIKVVASCKSGKLLVLGYDPPPYNGVKVESKVASLTLNFPTGTLAPVVRNDLNFEEQLYAGVYILNGTICATYNFGGNAYVKYPFLINVEKKVKCAIDFSCLVPKYRQLMDNIRSGNCDVEKSIQIILKVNILLKFYELLVDADEDAEQCIEEIEQLLGCSCRCPCEDGVAIINNAPTTSYTIEGCGISEVIIGLTKKYIANIYGYSINVNGGGNVLTPGAQLTNGCEKEMPLNFSLPNLYSDIKERASADEGFWAGVIKQYFVDNGLDTTCLGISDLQFEAMPLYVFFQNLIAKVCAGAGCSGTVSNVLTSKVGGNVLLSFTATGSSTVRVFVDGILVSEVLAANGSVTLLGYADGVLHNYVIYPVCSNGSIGTPNVGTFQLLACPIIAPANLSSTNAANVVCPFSLTSLVVSTPPGITIEWHSLNNTLTSSLVPTPTAVLGGTYYAFAKDSGGCYSPSVAVQVTCDSGAGTVTAPQNLLVVAQVGSKLVSFQSAAYPPPANSYTLMRRLKSDPDVLGSYTTLGSTGSGITFNAGTNRYELTDLSSVDNTLYVYRAISNGGSNPQTDYDYANIICPALSITPASTSLAYSFVNSGGQIDKYDVQLYDAGSVTLVSTETETPAFANPITGSFTSLPTGTAYRVRIKAYIGTYSKVCGFYNASTIPADPATATLSFVSYAAGDFTFALSAAIPSANVVVTVATVDGYADMLCSSSSAESDAIAPGDNATIFAGATTGVYSSTIPMTNVSTNYKRGVNITVNGISRTNGETLTIGATIVTVAISNSCDLYPF